MGRRASLIGIMAGASAWGRPNPAAARPLTLVDVDKGKPGERDVFSTASGVKFADVQTGTGEVAKNGDLVLINLVGSLEGGQVFLDTRELGTPLAFQVGTTNKYVPEGISTLVEGMSRGSIRLAVLPPELGYAAKGASMPGGKAVPPNARVFYELELLRCQSFTLGLACCSEQTWSSKGGSCVVDKQQQQVAGAGTGTGTGAVEGAAAPAAAK